MVMVMMVVMVMVMVGRGGEGREEPFQMVTVVCQGKNLVYVI